MSILASDLRSRAPGRRPPGRRVLVVSDPGALAGGNPRRRVQQRRKAVLEVLGGATALAAVGALVVGGALTTLFVSLLLALVAYVTGLVQLRLNAERARSTVRRLPVRQAEPEPVGHDEVPIPLAAGH